MFARRAGGLACALALAGCGGGAFTVGPAIDDGGSSDASSDADAGGGFCATKGASASFCADFDEGAFPAPWDAPIELGAAQVVESSDDATSPPRSLFVTVPALGPASGDAGAPTAAAGVVVRGLAAGSPRVELEIAIVQASFPSALDAKAGLLLVQIGAGSGGYTLALGLRPSAKGPFAVELVETSTIGAKPRATTIAALPKLGAWSHVILDARFVPDGAACVVTIDDASQSVPIAPPAGAALTTDRSLAVGIAAVGAAGEAAIRFDDVTWSGSP